jgi:hypothetical protein
VVVGEAVVVPPVLVVPAEVDITAVDVVVVHEPAPLAGFGFIRPSP